MKTKEKEIKTLSDFKAYEHFARMYERYFECPKCHSSLICLNDEFSNNNVANSIDDNNIQHMEKIVLGCCACNHTDILLKFLKEKKRHIYDEGTPFRIGNSKPKWISPGGLTI